MQGHIYLLCTTDSLSMEFKLKFKNVALVVCDLRLKWMETDKEKSTKSRVKLHLNIQRNKTSQ